jgi:hypothetical protein
VDDAGVDLVGDLAAVGGIGNEDSDRACATTAGVEIAGERGEPEGVVFDAQP